MTPFRSDRPYGSFPGPGQPAPEPEPAVPAPRVPLRMRIWRRIAAPLAVFVLLLATWSLVGAVTTGGLRAINEAEVQPTPTATPALAAQVYAAVQPSVVQIIASGAGADPSSGAGVVVDEMGDILTSLHIIADAKSIRVQFYDGTEATAEVVTTLPDKDIAVLRPSNIPAK